MIIRIWGIRGSFPVASKNILKYGGNTACLEVRSNKGDIIIIDCGSGMWQLGKHLDSHDEFEKGGKKAHILLSHKHWDHIQGLPLFKPLFGKNKFDFYIRPSNGYKLGKSLLKQFEKTYFSIPLRKFSSHIKFKPIDAGDSFQIGNINIKVFRLNHPGICNGFRLEEDNKVFVYSSDTSPFSGILMKNEFITKDEMEFQKDDHKILETLKIMKKNYLESLENADFVIYDTHFTDSEFEIFPHFGHSTPTQAIKDCELVGVKHLSLFHHSPSRTDSQMDEILNEYKDKTRMNLSAAYEGMEITL